MRLVILGGPGSGKGTQAQKLCQTIHIAEISTSDILREAIASQTNLGIQAQAYVKGGELVPDELMIQFMRERLLKSDIQAGWLLEGYPRTAFQAEELDFLLDDLNQKLDWAIYLQVNKSIMMKRSLERSLFDDQPEIIQRRINRFEEFTIPILEYYERRHKLIIINGELEAELVEKEILQKISN